MSGVEVNTQKPVDQYYDTHTLYIDSGVATEYQIAESLKLAIKDAQKYLSDQKKKIKIDQLTQKIKQFRKLKKDVKKLEQERKKINDNINIDKDLEQCRYKVNLLVTKEGAYHGYGYIRISSSKIYWMLLGRNPDGSERFEEKLDPTWISPEPKPELSISEQIKLKNKANKTWADVAEDEEKHIHPIIRTPLDPIITIPGFKYDENQYSHLKDVAVEKNEDPDNIPDTGFFEISRGYAKGAPPGTIKHRICARNVPDWLPIEAFRITFQPYVTTSNNYPKVNFVQTKKGKIVFINFDPSTIDALFSLVMTKKTRFTHPEDSSLKTELIFMHAYVNNKKRRY